MFRWILIILVLFLISTSAIAQQVSVEGQIAFASNIYMNGDYKRALDEYEKAKAMDATRADVHYFIGCTYARLGRTDDALASLQQAADLAGGNNPNMQGKALFRIALLYEQRGDLTNATQAWSAYISFAEKNSSAITFVLSAQSRLDMIAKKTALDANYAAVRDRINKNRSK